MKKILVAPLAIVMALGASSACAALYTFDFTNDGSGSSNIAKQFMSESGGLTLTALAQYREYVSGPDIYGTTRLSWGGTGLYIDNHGNDSSHQIDGFGWDERVLFEFTQPTTIKSVSFTAEYVGSDDDFAFWVGQTWNNANLVNGDIDIPNSNTYTFQQTWTGNYFGIGAIGDNDDFKIRSIVVDANVVPEPTTMLLFGTGIVGLAALGRRRKK